MSDTSKTQNQQGLPRREFVRTAAMTAAGLTIVPRHVLGKGQTPPSDMVNVAGVGVGGMGRSNMTALSSQNIVALCDVDWGYAGRGFDGIPQQVAAAEKRLADATTMTAEQRVRAQAQIAGLKQLGEKVGKATRYVDYREMLEKQKDIDAVMIATPDHTHAVIATAAMSLGKHVYVQKPLAWSVEECRALAKKASETKVVTQMGNQGHSTDDARLVNEYIQSGAIGDVREVHIWTNRPLAYWPQGIPRPAPSAMTVSPDSSQPWNLRFVMDKLAGTMDAAPHAMPDKLAWDLFLGPAPQIAYHPVYHPFNWRGWTDWGVGAHRRHGRAPDRPRVLGARPRIPDDHRDAVHALQQGHLSDGHDDVLRVPGPGSQARREADVVRRGPAAAEARGTRRGGVRQGGRRALRGQQGQVDARHVREQPAAVAEVVRRQHAEAAPDVQADRDIARDELDRRDPRTAGGLVAVLVRREDSPR